MPHSTETTAHAQEVASGDVVDWVGRYPFEFAKPEEMPAKGPSA
ncbi:MAG: hypothetical protein ACRD5L_00670 [Bryobacteraceae bacterium]